MEFERDCQGEGRVQPSPRDRIVPLRLMGLDRGSGPGCIVIGKSIGCMMVGKNILDALEKLVLGEDLGR